jgi:hypothetical protein
MWETEAGGLQVQGKPGLHMETSKNQPKTQNTINKQTKKGEEGLQRRGEI